MHSLTHMISLLFTFSVWLSITCTTRFRWRGKHLHVSEGRGNTYPGICLQQHGQSLNLIILWYGHVHSAIFRMANQQDPTV